MRRQVHWTHKVYRRALVRSVGREFVCGIMVLRQLYRLFVQLLYYGYRKRMWCGMRVVRSGGKTPNAAQDRSSVRKHRYREVFCAVKDLGVGWFYRKKEGTFHLPMAVWLCTMVLTRVAFSLDTGQSIQSILERARQSDIFVGPHELSVRMKVWGDDRSAKEPAREYQLYRITNLDDYYFKGTEVSYLGPDGPIETYEESALNAERFTIVDNIPKGKSDLEISAEVRPHDQNCTKQYLIHPTKAGRLSATMYGDEEPWHAIFQKYPELVTVASTQIDGRELVEMSADLPEGEYHITLDPQLDYRPVRFDIQKDLSRGHKSASWAPVSSMLRWVIGFNYTNDDNGVSLVSAELDQYDGNAKDSSPIALHMVAEVEKLNSINGPIDPERFNIRIPVGALVHDYIGGSQDDPLTYVVDDDNDLLPKTASDWDKSTVDSADVSQEHVDNASRSGIRTPREHSSDRRIGSNSFPGWIFIVLSAGAALYFGRCIRRRV